jgi:hypothetical protein
MPRLNETVKAFIVTRLACKATPTDVVDEVKEIFGLDLPRQHVHYYDPDAPASKAPKKWRELHAETRKQWLAGAAEAGIAFSRRRLEELDRLYERAKRSGNLPLAAQLLEQAAKEQGGVFTNRHRIKHEGQVRTTGVLLLPQAPSSPEDWSKGAREQQASLEHEASRAAEAGARG